MKRFFICSDIHGRIGKFKEALSREDKLDGVIVAGDLQLDTYEITELVYRYFPDNCIVRMVAGNCDAYEPSAGLLQIDDTFDISEGHKVFLTHGHRYRSGSVEILSYAAEEKGADIVIFGHTHCVCNMKEGGILFLNAGAMKDGRYMILELTDDDQTVVKCCTL